MIPKRRIVPLFIPHLGCPNDCVFCNQRRITGRTAAATSDTVRAAVRAVPADLPSDTPIQLAFYGGSFTAIPVDEQTALLNAARPLLERFRSGSLRVSTRPDCIDRATLERLLSYGVRTVELGVQSMNTDVLLAARRGHTPADTVRAARLIRAYGLELILQMMTGLPGDTPDKSLDTARQLIDMNPDGVRVYPTVILRDTALFDLWRRGEYIEHTVDDAVSLCARLYDMFERAGVPVIRMGLNPTADLSGGDAAGGAYHPAFGELVYSRVYLGRTLALLRPMTPFTSVTLGVAQDRVSSLVGHAGCNIAAMRREWGPISVHVRAARVSPGEIVILDIENGP